MLLHFWLQTNDYPQLLPDVPEPSTYWNHDDPRALAAHKGIIAEIVLDFQPLSLVNNKGFVINKRQVVAHLQVHFDFRFHEICFLFLGSPRRSCIFTSSLGEPHPKKNLGIAQKGGEGSQILIFFPQKSFLY